MKPTIYIIPFILPWNRSADYQRQTCRKLAGYYNVIAYMQRDAVFFLKAVFSTRRYPIYKHVRFYRPLYLFPFRRFGVIEELNQRISYILFEIFYLWRKEAILWIFDPVLYFLPKLSHSISIYDCVDYHPGYHKNRKFAEIQQKENALIRSVDYFFVNSHILYALHKQTRKPDAVVPQGFKLEEFRKNDTRIKRTYGKPVIGYIGALDDRLNLHLLQKLVRRNPQWQFIFWGTTKQDDVNEKETINEKLDKLLHQSNVTTGDSKDIHEIASITQQFDVGIIPHLDKLPGIKYSYPMKVLEYFYMGKPVVSTSIEELKRFPTFVKIGSTVEEWEDYINMLLSKKWPKHFQYEQRAIAEENSWENKIHSITQYILTKQGSI